MDGIKLFSLIGDFSVNNDIHAQYVGVMLMVQCQKILSVNLISTDFSATFAGVSSCSAISGSSCAAGWGENGETYV